MKFDAKEEKALRNLVEKDATDRPVFLTQEEGKKLFEELDAARKLAYDEVRRSESLVRKYADDTISESIETMLSEISVLHNERNGLKDFLSTVNSMVQRTTRIPCIHGETRFSSSNTRMDCTHCETLGQLVRMIDKVEKGTK